MDHFLSRKKEIESALVKLKEFNAKQSKENAQLKREIHAKQQLINHNISKIKALQVRLDTEKAYIEKLKQKIEALRLQKVEKCRQRLIYIQEKINKIVFSKNIKIFGDLEGIQQLISETFCFKNVNKKLKIIFLGAKKQLKKNVTDCLIKTLFEPKQMHDFLYTLHVLVKYEHVFNEIIFYDFIFEILNRDYSLKFANNRLDKPEWIFTFLLGEIKKYKRYIIFYDNIRNRSFSELYYENDDNRTVKTDNLKICNDSNLKICNDDNPKICNDGNLKICNDSNLKICNDDNLKICNDDRVFVIENNSFTSNNNVHPTTSKLNQCRNNVQASCKNIHDFDIQEPIQNKRKQNQQCSSNSTEKEFLKRIIALININFNNILSSTSTQKRNLIIHFCDEFINFKIEVYKISTINIHSTEINETLKAFEKDRIREDIYSIFSKPLDLWFREMHRILDETISLGVSMLKIDRSLLFESVLYFCTEVNRFFDVFLERFAFLSDDEKEMICKIFWGIEEMKSLLIERGIMVYEVVEKTKNEKLRTTDNESIDAFYKTGDLFDKNKPSVFKDGFEFDITPLVTLNKKNYRLIKSIMINEAESLLKKLGNFKFITERTIIEVVIKFGRMDEIYGKYFDRSIFKDVVNLINEGLVGLVMDKLDSERFFRVKGFYSDISNIFGDFQAKEYIEAVVDLFEGRKRDDEIFMTLKDIYLND